MLQQNNRILRLREVLDRTGLSRSTIYDLMKKGKFPRQIALTPGCVGWSEDDIQEWFVKLLEKNQARNSTN